MQDSPEECRSPRKAEAADPQQPTAVHEETARGTPYAIIWKDGEELRIY